MMMEDTQDIRGKNVAKATQLSKPVEEDDSSTKPTAHIPLYV